MAEHNEKNLQAELDEARALLNISERKPTEERAIARADRERLQAKVNEIWAMIQQVNLEKAANGGLKSD